MFKIFFHIASHPTRKVNKFHLCLVKSNNVTGFLSDWSHLAGHSQTNKLDPSCQTGELVKLVSVFSPPSETDIYSLTALKVSVTSWENLLKQADASSLLTISLFLVTGMFNQIVML